MPTVRLPHNWRPRPYQMPAWTSWEAGCKRQLLVWHRRAGKDDVALHMSAVAAHERPATYWHLLPEYKQGRKAIWNAVNPHTGKRRIDEAFPHELRANTNDQEMFIRFKCGATWQVVGSDNYNSNVGSPPAGVTFSEWALSNPSAWAYLAPILAENGGWATFITTPRGRNHVKSQLDLTKQDPKWFTQVLTVDDTAAISREIVEEQRREYRSLYGDDAGDALIEQEYWCNFDAPIVGAFYAKEIGALEREGRIRRVDYDAAIPVSTAWDLGYSDDTVIWFFQVLHGEVRVIDYYASHGKDVPHYADVVKSKGYRYGVHWLPHDADPKTLAANGRSIFQQLWDLGVKGRITPHLSVQDGIQAARMTLRRCWFDEEKCKDGLESLRQYQREWDDDRKMFKDEPRHDWTSHAADGFRYLSLVWKQPQIAPVEPAGRVLNVGSPSTVTMNDLWKHAGQPRGEVRI